MVKFIFLFVFLVVEVGYLVYISFWKFFYGIFIGFVCRGFSVLVIYLYFILGMILVYSVFWV